MKTFDHNKYQPVPRLAMPKRSWPNHVINKAPDWVSVDLRDGNQALLEPMNITQKQQMWALLIKLGFKEIEVGFPSASQPDYDFVRWLIEENQIPQDVSIQVLVPARETLIARTFEALSGVHQAVVHLYNSTSPVQRQRVFNLDCQSITAIARDGATWIKHEAERYPQTQWTFEYSPESFSSTEMDYAVEICDTVLDVWQPTPTQPCIINLPTTVEVSTANVFADQVEYFSSHISRRDSVVLSVHTHNDRGGAVASAELALLAGAQRVEGTLFGNGERTGNMDILTMAMNLYSQGIDPALDLSNPAEIMQVYKTCTGLKVHPRHPWFGELVYTAFSGSHQDAIRKCLQQQKVNEPWQVAYLPIDPRDIGRDYQAVIRVNSQSGKGGIAFVLERDYGVMLPRWLQIEMAQVVQQKSEHDGGEIGSEQLHALFQQHFIVETPLQLQSYQLEQQSALYSITIQVTDQGKSISLHGRGEGGLSAFVDAWQQHSNQRVLIENYNEHAMGMGTDAQAAAYVQLDVNGQHITGAAFDVDTMSASFKAILSALNRCNSA